MPPKHLRLGLTLLAGTLVATAGVIAIYQYRARPRGYQALRVAVAQGDREKVLALLNGGLDAKAPLYSSLLVTAIQHSDDKMVELLLKHGAEPNEGSMAGTPLGAAAALNRTTTVALLLSAGAQPDLHGEGGAPLERAVENCSMDAARLLIERGARKLATLSDGVRTDACRRCPAIVQVAAPDAACH